VRTGHRVDFALERFDLAVARDDLAAEHLVAADERLHRLVDRQLGEAAHLGDQAAQRVMSSSNALTVCSAISLYPNRIGP
jgi:hypothetical protein